MILYGRTISPFVRRVAIWCAMQGRDVELKPLAATEPQDMEAIRAVHPGRRVPVLQTEDGALLIETFARGGKHYLVCYPFDGRIAHQSLGTVVTRRDGEKLQRYRVPVTDITRGEVEDVPLQAGDIVFVPERVF